MKHKEVTELNYKKETLIITSEGRIKVLVKIYHWFKVLESKRYMNFKKKNNLR